MLKHVETERDKLKLGFEQASQVSAECPMIMKGVGQFHICCSLETMRNCASLKLTHLTQTNST